MTIEIIDLTLQDDGINPSIWALTIEITDGLNTYLLNVTEAGATAEGDLQAVLEAKEASLFAIAAGLGVVPDVTFSGIPLIKVIKALALVILDEINILRAAAALAPRTIAQLRIAIKNKLKSLI